MLNLFSKRNNTEQRNIIIFFTNQYVGGIAILMVGFETSIELHTQILMYDPFLEAHHCTVYQSKINFLLTNKKYLHSILFYNQSRKYFSNV